MFLFSLLLVDESNQASITLLQDCILPLNVHQRQLCSEDRDVLGKFHWGLGKLYFFLSMGNWSGSICVLLTCASLQPLGNLVSHGQAFSAACSLSVFSICETEWLVYLNPCEFLFISPAFSVLDAAVEDMALLGFYEEADSCLMLWASLMLILGVLWVLAAVQFCVRVLIMLIIIQVWPHPRELPWLCRAVKGM